MGSKMKMDDRADGMKPRERWKNGSNHSFHDTAGKINPDILSHPESTELPKVQEWTSAK